jgi:hypothetical protein
MNRFGPDCERRIQVAREAAIFLVLIILIGYVLFLEGCLMVVQKEHRLIHPKVVWIIELPWVFSLFGLFDYAFLSNFVVQGFISVAILGSFRNHLESKGQGVGILAYLGASCVSLAQSCSFVISLFVVLWPLFSLEPLPRSISDLINPAVWTALVLGMYVLFVFTMYRLKERVRAIDKAERKDRSTKEIRSDLNKSLKKAKEGPPPVFTVVLESNPNEHASVWLLHGKHILENGKIPAGIAEGPGAEKVVGPVSAEQALTAFSALKSALTRANIPFESHTTSA